MKKINNSGFAAVEAVLILVIVAIIGGTGYYVYHANKKSNDTLNSASKVAQSTPSKITAKKKTKNSSKTDMMSQNYLSIKEWGVRAPVTNGDTLTYRLTTNHSAQIISRKLAQEYNCADRGAGLISRYKGTDTAADVYPLAPAGQTVAQYAKGSSVVYGQVGGYYFFFTHEQAACGNTYAGSPGSPSVGEQAQTSASDYTQNSIVPKLQAIP